MSIYKRRHSPTALITTTALVFLCMTGGLTAQSRNSERNDSTSASGNRREVVEPGKIYNDRQPTRWMGKSLTLQDVTVQDTNATRNFWVGSDEHHRLLVVKPESIPSLNAMRLHKGDIVTIAGVVRPASDYMSTKTGAEKGSMDDAKNSSGVFLMAYKVTIISSTQH
jgi:hypothetical protein